MHTSDATPLKPDSPLLNGCSPPSSPTKAAAFFAHHDQAPAPIQAPLFREGREASACGPTEVEKQAFEETMIESVVRRLSTNVSNQVTLCDGRVVERRKSFWVLPPRKSDTRHVRLLPYVSDPTDVLQLRRTHHADQSKPSAWAVAAGVGATVGLGAGVVGCAVGLLAVGATAAVIGGVASAVSLGGWAAFDASRDDVVQAKQ